MAKDNQSGRITENVSKKRIVEYALRTPGLVQFQLLESRILQWDKSHRTRFQEALNDNGADGKTILALYVRRSIDIRFWVEQLAQLVAYEDAKDLIDEPIESLVQEYTKQVLMVCRRAAGVNVIPQQSLDQLQIESAKFLVRSEHNSIGLGIDLYSQKFDEWSASLDGCYQELEVLLQLADGAQGQAIDVPSALSAMRTDEISRAELLDLYGIKTQALYYRIKEMGHPKPIREEGRKQWFSRTEVEAWRKSTS